MDVFAGLLMSQVEPVVAALDGASGPAALEEGRPSAADRAARLRAQVAAMYAEGAPASHADMLTAYEVAKSLLGDLWSVVQADAWAAAPLAGAWARGAISRAFAGSG